METDPASKKQKQDADGQNPRSLPGRVSLLPFFVRSFPAAVRRTEQQHITGRRYHCRRLCILKFHIQRPGAGKYQHNRQNRTRPFCTANPYTADCTQGQEYHSVHHQRIPVHPGYQQVKSFQQPSKSTVDIDKILCRSSICP